MRRGLVGTVAALAASGLVACGTTRSETSVQAFCDAWRAHLVEVAAGAPAVGPAPGAQPPPPGPQPAPGAQPPLRPILSTAPKEINKVVGKYAAGVVKQWVDQDARSQIEAYVTGHCGP